MKLIVTRAIENSLRINYLLVFKKLEVFSKPVFSIISKSWQIDFNPSWHVPPVWYLDKLLVIKNEGCFLANIWDEKLEGYIRSNLTCFIHILKLNSSAYKLLCTWKSSDLIYSTQKFVIILIWKSSNKLRMVT